VDLDRLSSIVFPLLLSSLRLSRFRGKMLWSSAKKKEATANPLFSKNIS
jgi:hypothetical protein